MMCNSQLIKIWLLLLAEEPRSLIAQVRALAPDIEVALEIGHTLTLIHQRLNEAGMQISYDALRIYRKRIQREKRPLRSAANSEARFFPDSKQSAQETEKGKFDPAKNFRKQVARRPIFEYPSGPPDEEKLF